jgi:preprotein translocase subunit SecG
MINILLVVHIIVGILLVISILLQKTSSGNLANLASNTTGMVSARGAANFLTKTTSILGAIFMINAIVLGNFSTRKSQELIEQIEIQEQQAQKQEASQEVPIAE